jgi:hypothetical protein
MSGSPIQKDWAMRVVDRMDRFYTRMFGEISEIMDQYLFEDGWQIKATIEGVKGFTPTLHWPKAHLPQARAKFVGGLLGHSVSHFETLCQPKSWVFFCDAFNTIFDLSERLSGEATEERFDHDENLFALEHRRFLTASSSSLRIAGQQCVAEQKAFFEGYTKALKKGSITIDLKGKGGTLRTQAYQMVAIFGPLLRLHANSVHDVHRFLVKMMGKQRAGDIKRTEGICRAIGMRFRSPGRPGPKDKIPHSIE